MMSITTLLILCFQSIICNAFSDILLLGGKTTGQDFSTSIELVTPTFTCKPDIPEIPVRRIAAFSAVLGSRVYYCGGFKDVHSRDCHTFLLGQKRWEEDSSMRIARMGAGMSVIGDRIFVTGGNY